MAKKTATTPSAPLNCVAYSIGARNRTPPSRYTSKDDRVLAEITAKYFSSGYSIIQQKGFWFDTNEGELIQEDSRMVIIATDKPDKIVSWRNELAYSMQQHSLLEIELGVATLFSVDPAMLAKIPKNK